LVKEYGLTAIPWTSYLLYGDPAFILFKTKIKPPRSKFKLPVFLSKKQLAWFLGLVAILSLGIYLNMWLPTLNPSTYALFLRSRQFFGQGKNREVIVVAKQIIQKEPAFLNIYPLIAEAEHKLGQRELALKYYFDYALYSEQKKEVKHLASAYLGIGWIYQLQADYARAFDFYQKALALSREKKDILNEATALRRLAEWYADKGEPDKALQLLTKSSEINRMRLHIYEHKYNLACDYFDIGLVFSGKGDLGAAKEFYDKSRVLFEKLKLKNELSDCYFNLGEIYLSEKKYQQALKSYQAGLKLDQEQDNKLNIPSDYNMIGELYLEMGNLFEAEKFLGQAVLLAKQSGARPELADAYYDLGLLFKKRSQKDEAREHFRLAQEIYSQINPAQEQKVKEELLLLDKP
jgi:tetratricopeptide (TPR) repeat protein